MPWKVHRFGEDPKLDEILSRRFGSEHELPCDRPEVLTCAMWKCQEAGCCQALSVVDRTAPARQ